MAILLRTYIQNNYGLIDVAANSQSAILDTDGALTLCYMESWADTKSERTIIGSNVISWYRDTVSTGINRDFDVDDIGEEGPLLNIFEIPKTGKYVACIGEWSALSANANICIGERDGDNITWEDPAALFKNDVLYGQTFAACSCNAGAIAHGISTTDDKLICSRYDYVNNEAYTLKQEDSYSYYPIFACHTEPDGEGGVAVGVGATAGDVYYVPFSWADAAYGTPVNLDVADGVTLAALMEVDIAVDPYTGAIIIFTVVLDGDDAPNYDAVYELHISEDGGSTFSTINLDTAGFLGGDELFIDVCNYARGTPRLMSGADGGFLLGYTRVNSEGYARPYVHLCEHVSSGGDIGSYTIGEAKECGMAVGPYSAENNMVGPIFFKAPADMQSTIDPVQNVYIAYQIGEGNHLYADYAQASVKPYGLALERLDEQAFPLTDSYEYNTESAGAGEIVATLGIAPTPTTHEDFYNTNYYGNYTALADDAFAKYGTAITIKQYEPKDTIWVGGITAYESPPTEHLVKCFLDSASWNRPNQALNQSDYAEFIDRDLRKIYLPPNFYMGYSVVISKANEAYQTIYLAEFDAFTYEIRQIVPKFIDNQIFCWEANCYNVGNFDVWSRGGGQT